MKRFVAFVCGCIALSSTNAWSWGATGHKIVGEVGTVLVTDGNDFWPLHEPEIGSLSNVPDKVWKALPTGNLEKPTHFFEPDGYFQDPTLFQGIPRSYNKAVEKYTEKFVIKHGTAIWRVVQMYELALKYLKTNKFKEGIEIAGVLSHYIGDLSQPLHVTTNYDGQFSGNPGIHAFYESSNIENFETENIYELTKERANWYLKNQKLEKTFENGLMEGLFALINRSYDQIDPLLKIDKKYGRKQEGQEKLIALAVDRIADGAAVYSIVLSHLWKESGLLMSPGKISVKTPAWVAPNYSPSKPLHDHDHGDSTFGECGCQD